MALGAIISAAILEVHYVGGIGGWGGCKYSEEGGKE